MPIKQDNRSLAIKTALGPDVLGVRSISVNEHLSRLFQIEAELSSEDGEIDFDKVVGHPATIRLDVAQKEKRFFNGFVSRLVQVANRGGYAHYRATIVPWLWLLTRTSDCRIFQKKTVPAIIEEVFKAHGFDDYQLKLSASYAEREYVVQYRETDFNFVSRLMEQEGIYYFFSHEDGKHTLVLADSISAHKPFKGYEEIAFHELEKGASTREVITDWTMEKELQPGAVALNDFDFKKPKASLRANSNVTRKYGKAQFEIYDYPGEYVEHGDGERLAQARLDELQSQCEVFEGQASARGLATGGIFKLKGHARRDQNREYLVTGGSLQADAGEFSAGGGSGGDGGFFSCNFTAIDKAQQFRPARQTPKPIVQGTQTAMVVGPSGETIHCDNFGRIKVQFHWDRHAKGDDNASCWIRVSQPWGGKGWGGMFIPHVGQEVVVSFEEGDPDRPLITGRVYNPDQMPPLELPANKTKSVIRDHGGNHIRMEGSAGSEQIHLSSPFGNSKVSIGAPNHGPGISLLSDNNLTLNIGQDWKIDILQNRIEHVQGMVQEVIDKDKEFWVKGNLNVKGGANIAEIFLGFKHDTVVVSRSELTLGSKNESTVGLLSEICGGFKIDIHKGKHYVHQPDEIQLTSARRVQKAEEEYDKLTTLKQTISGICDQKIGTLNAKIDKMTTHIDALEETIQNAYKLMAGKIDLESKADVHMVAAGDIILEATNLIVGAELKVFGSSLVVTK